MSFSSLVCGSCLDKRTGFKVVSRVDGCRREQRPVLAKGPGHMSRRQQQMPVPKRWWTLEEEREDSGNLNTGNGSQRFPGEIQQVRMYMWTNYATGPLEIPALWGVESQETGHCGMRNGEEGQRKWCMHAYPICSSLSTQILAAGPRWLALYSQQDQQRAVYL